VSRFAIALLLGAPAVCFLGTIAACSSILGFEELQTSIDASAPLDSAVVTVVADGAEPVDASVAVPPDASDDSSPPTEADGDAGCGPSEALTLDAVNAKGAVSAAHVDSYMFAIAKPENVVVRVRTGALSAEVEVAATCDGNVAALPPLTPAPDGVYTRGNLPHGTYFLHIAWDATVTANAPYTFDVMSETLAANTCAMATALTPGSPVNGNTFTGADVSTAVRRFRCTASCSTASSSPRTPRGRSRAPRARGRSCCRPSRRARARRARCPPRSRPPLEPPPRSSSTTHPQPRRRSSSARAQAPGTAPAEAAHLPFRRPR
jgi:hypothetical protein